MRRRRLSGEVMILLQIGSEAATTLADAVMNLRPRTWTLANRPSGRYSRRLVEGGNVMLPDKLLDAAEAVVVRRRIAEDGLPPGTGETATAAIDGLWLYWVLGLAPVNQGSVVRVRVAVEDLLTRAELARSPATAKVLGGDHLGRRRA
jgi:hypothetical protein